MAHAEEAANVLGEASQIERRGLDRGFAVALSAVSTAATRAGNVERAVEAGERAVAIYRSLAERNPLAYEGRLAAALDNLSVSPRLADAGRPEEALSAAREAVEIRRVLVGTDRASFEHELAISLSGYGVCLLRLGRYSEALAASEEADRILESLAQREPEAYGLDLSGCLNNLGVVLLALEQFERALAITVRAIDIRRRHWLGPLPDVELANALNNAGRALLHLGRREEGLPCSMEALDIFEALSVSQPLIYGEGYEWALKTVRALLRSLERREDEVRLLERDVEHYRLLAANDESGAGNVEVARSLVQVSLASAELGRYEGASEAMLEATTLFRPEMPDVALELAVSLDILGFQYARRERFSEAVEAAQEAVAVLERLLPSATVDHVERELAACLQNLGNRLREVSRIEEAVRATTKAVDVWRALNNTSDGGLQGELAASLMNLCGQLLTLNRLEAAADAGAEAVEVYAALAVSSPDSRAADNLDGALQQLSEVRHHLLGENEAARVCAEHRFRLYRDLVLQAPLVYEPYFADASASYLEILDEAGDWPQAMDVSAVIVNSYRQIMSGGGADMNFGQGLLNFAVVRLHAGRDLRSALSATEEAIALYQGSGEEANAEEGKERASQEELGLATAIRDAVRDALTAEDDSTSSRVDDSV